MAKNDKVRNNNGGKKRSSSASTREESHMDWVSDNCGTLMMGAVAGITALAVYGALTPDEELGDTTDEGAVGSTMNFVSSGFDSIFGDY